ncbi:heme exporter protein CcmD [Cellvibrio sp. ARAG 10.3]|uniref:heme exporter protein CcmD n=1 Tax=Cellvibrio sp. ARAG 10.3 TaxID=3451358 RepID=UPI003F44BA21
MNFQFDSFASFMAMNGHGPFVWAAYGITFVVLVYLLVSPLLQRRQFLRQQARQQRAANRSV